MSILFADDFTQAEQYTFKTLVNGGGWFNVKHGQMYLNMSGKFV